MNERHLYNVQNYLLCHKETSDRFNLFIDIGANKMWHSNYLKKHFKKSTSTFFDVSNKKN